MLSSRALAVLALSLLPAITFAQMPAAAPATRESVTAVTPSASDVLPFKATEATLPNGLRVIVVPTGFPNIVSIQIPVQTGSRNEVEPGKSGFAHFFEHMMFRGTPRYSPEKFTEIMTRAGARNNASTSDDRTMYYATFARDDLEQIIELMGDNFQNLSYAEPEFRTEAKAVLGEYNKNASEPAFKLFELTRKTAFGTHTYGHTTMGFIEDIENMPNQFEYSKQFFDRWYRPEYTAIVVAGDVTPAQVLPLIRKHWGAWKPGTYKASIPAEPPATAPKYAHAVWPTPTSPLISVAFRNPAFSETIKDNAALDLVAGIYFGPTSDIYRKLVVTEQKLDSFGGSNSSNVDPGLFRITARLKDPKDAVYVRDEILRTVNRARTELVPSSRLADAKSAERYGFVRSLDNTGSIAATLAEYVKYGRSYSTLNNVYRLYAALTPEDLRAAAARYFTDASLVVTSLSNTPLAAALANQPPIASLAPAVASTPAGGDEAKRALRAKLDAIIARDMKAVPARLPKLDILEQKSQLPQIAMKLVFNAGSAYDPPGMEGLAALSAAMISGAGSRDLTVSEIRQLLYPMAGSFTGGVDKELATFTASIHKDNWHEFLHIVLDQLAKPGFRADDFQRLKDRQLTALTQDLRSNNEEELGKERLQTNIFAGTPYGHPALGTVEGIKAITLDDVKSFVRDHYTLGDLKAGVSGDVPNGFKQVTSAILANLPAGRPAPRPTALKPKRPRGMEVEIIRKDTRSTAISFGLPIVVTRSHPDFAALNVARSYLGEHRMSNAHLYQRIRAVRGMNYGDYAYIEAFPGGMFRFFPSPNIVRRNQLFEVWIRPVEPQNAHMALRIANAELRRLMDDGISQADFEDTRDYLMKNVYVMTATQDAQLGYALDSKWYRTGEFTSYMRNALSKLTRQQVNDAIRRHLSATDLSVVIITRDAEGLRDALVSDAFSPIKYDSEKPAALLAEDKVIGARKLSIRPESVKITPVEEVFAR